MTALSFMWWMLGVTLILFLLGGAVTSQYKNSYDFMRRTNALGSLLFGAGQFCLSVAGISLLIAALR